MRSSGTALERVAFYFTCGSAVAILFSIAASHILLALALAALLMSGVPLRFPPVKLPLALFFAGTVISMVLSSDPASGRPQIRKFFVFLLLLLVYSLFRHTSQALWLIWLWIGVATLSALRSLVQFSEKVAEAERLGQPFYTFYMTERITGFMSHWMTFGGQLMIVLLMMSALVFFGRESTQRLVLWVICGAICSLGILLSFGRGVWLATALAGLYLVWYWRKVLVLALPVVLAILVMAGPDFIRARVRSSFQPHGDIDSNQHRVVTYRTGVAMIKAHPLFGLGPEQVNAQFEKYLPGDIPRPLPTGWYGHLHNIYLHYAAERGIPTLMALLWLLGRVIHDFWHALKKVPPGPGVEKAILHGAIAVVLAILIEGVFELNLGDTEVLSMFLVVVALGYVVRDNVLRPGSAHA